MLYLFEFSDFSKCHQNRTILIAMGKMGGKVNSCHFSTLFVHYPNAKQGRFNQCTGVICHSLNMFIRSFMFYLSNQTAIYSHSSQWVAVFMQKQESRMKFIITTPDAALLWRWLIEVEMGYLVWLNYVDEMNYDGMSDFISHKTLPSFYSKSCSMKCHCNFSLGFAADF